MQDIKELIEVGKETKENGSEFIEDRQELIEDLFEKAEVYLKTNVDLFKLKAVDRFAEVVSSLVANMTVLILFLFFLVMINVGIALWLGQMMRQSHHGFFVVAGFYAVLTLIIFLFRKSFIKSPISNSIISQMLK